MQFQYRLEGWEKDWQDAGGKRSEVELARSGYTDIRSVPPFEWSTLGGNVAYVALNSFESG